MLQLSFDPRLPITAHRGEILEALGTHRVIIVAGATGSGKSTQLPKLCLAAGRGTAGMIGHTQPRRIAARALAARVAAELGSHVGGAVGCQVRFDDRTGAHTRVKLMTDGILLRQLTADPLLRAYDTVIIDEAHERSLNIDLLLGALQRLSLRRPELRTIVTSATIDTSRLAEFFGGAPVIEVSGRSFPVEVRYRPLLAEDEDAAELSLPEGIVAAVRELGADGPGPSASPGGGGAGAGAGGASDAETTGEPRGTGPSGDVLVFLPGEKHIREAAQALHKARLAHTEVLPLFARLSAQQQARIFEAHSRRRVILATNVAETSLTVPAVRHVIDSGLARISRYSVRGKVQRLPLEPISRASAEQRKGRCGREAPGVCIRLYSQADFESREAFTPPEILRTHLASVLLQMAASGLGDAQEFPFLDPPDTRLVNDGMRQLQELGAMDERRQITRLGRQIAALPCDPKLGRMLLAAVQRHCLAEMLIIAAYLSGQDPRERPAEAQQPAGERHGAYADPDSDFLTVLRLWRLFEEHSSRLKGSALRKWCSENFLSFVRMREWQDLHTQLCGAVADLGLRGHAAAASYADLHRAILTGFLGGIGILEDRREYQGARGIRFVIAPGTAVAAKPPKWLVAASLLETTRLYARMVAAVQPGWIESAAHHLLKREYFEPHWWAARGQVSAFESVSLYGLKLAARRRIGYGAVAPAEAHAIFIQEALVAGHSRIEAAFVAANRQLREQAELLEAKTRRRDILVDEAAQAQFYAARIPRHVNSVAGFERWWRAAAAANPRLLHMSEADLLRPGTGQVREADFPDELAVAGNRLPLRYLFAPGAASDGATVLVPDLLLEELDAEQLAWLIPGWRLELIAELLRSLPKPVRRRLVPVPEQAREALAAVPTGSLPAFHPWLSDWIRARTGEQVEAADLAAAVLPDHLRLNIRVLGQADAGAADGADAAPVVRDEGRALSALRRRLRAAAPPRPRATSNAPAATSSAPEVHRRWDFGPLAQTATVTRGGVSFQLWPAVRDAGSGVALVTARSEAEARAISLVGLTRLAVLALPQPVAQLRRRLGEDRDLVLLSQGLALSRSVAESLSERAVRECFFGGDDPLPRDAEAFAQRLDARRAGLEDTALQLADSLRNTLQQRRAARAALAALRPNVFAEGLAQMQQQISALLPADFLESTPRLWLEQLPRYLQALTRRATRLAGDLQRDARLAMRVHPFSRALADLQARGVAPSALPALQQLHWMIEEFRVSVFAQELKTLLPVSERRLTEQLERVQALAAAR